MKINKGETIKKKTVLYYVFDGMADTIGSEILAGIQQSGMFTVRSIGLTLGPKRTQGGLTLLPDLDFIAEVDLPDLDASNTALLILPGGSTWRTSQNEEIFKLIGHCFREGIPLAATGEAFNCLADLGAEAFGSSGFSLDNFSAAIFDRLDIDDHLTESSHEVEHLQPQGIRQALIGPGVFVPLWPRAVANAL